MKMNVFLIGKYAAINGASVAVREVKRSNPHLKFSESTRVVYETSIATNVNIKKKASKS